MNAPKTFLEAVRYFADADSCLQFLVALRWPRGVKCPQCGSQKLTWLAKQRVWKCYAGHERPTFSLKTGKDGKYALWAPSASNPFTVIASKDGYQAQSTKVNIKANKTTTVNFGLKAVC